MSGEPSSRLGLLAIAASVLSAMLAVVSGLLPGPSGKRYS
jgi:hypothetical protein